MHKTPSAAPRDPDAPNSFIAARHEFMNAFGDLARGKRNWQLVAFAMAVSLALLATTVLRLASSARVVPYVVQIDRFNQLAAVQAADQMVAPNQRLIASQLAQFIRAVRTVLPAAASTAQAEMLHRGYAFAAPEAAGFLNDHFADPQHDPRVIGTRLTREVDVTGVLPVPKSDVWRLRWVETDRGTQPGTPIRRTAWEGYVTVRLSPPTTVETVQDNPLGVYVTSIAWTALAETSTSAGEDSAAAPDTAHVTGAIP